ncbi:hypothetical protein SLEP1_g18877 [Rubroshorea leprosula]|uniref:Uncharacterized protein n=1 Tax=Rubroshorea leprosula TaxID=152421 RepID=A0AAV5J4I2_9ROSI|nr:hypothetical protein SLEP1_g18877 [Rubroshorea leprosula]
MGEHLTTEPIKTGKIKGKIKDFGLLFKLVEKENREEPEKIKGSKDNLLENVAL